MNASKPFPFRAGLCAAFSVLFCACGADATGDVEVMIYGEDFIELGIPADEMQDGWSVRFSRFEVELDEVRVAGEPLTVDGPIELAEPSGGEGHALGSVTAAAQDHGDAEFVIARIAVEGTATRGSETKTFAWDFDQPIRYSRCETTTRVNEGDLGRFEITVHADHLFYDSLVSEEPALRFQPLADADTNGDGEITASELAAADLGDYDPGSDDAVEDLWAFLVAQTGTLGHVDGEGHCAASPIAR